MNSRRESWKLAKHKNSIRICFRRKSLWKSRKHESFAHVKAQLRVESSVKRSWRKPSSSEKALPPTKFPKSGEKKSLLIRVQWASSLMGNLARCCQAQSVSGCIHLKRSRSLQRWRRINTKVLPDFVVVVVKYLSIYTCKSFLSAYFIRVFFNTRTALYWPYSGKLTSSQIGGFSSWNYQLASRESHIRWSWMSLRVNSLSLSQLHIFWCIFVCASLVNSSNDARLKRTKAERRISFCVKGEAGSLHTRWKIQDEPDNEVASGLTCIIFNVTPYHRIGEFRALLAAFYHAGVVSKQIQKRLLSAVLSRT